MGRRDKKAFLSEQWKEIGGNNRMGKTRELIKKIWDTNEIFHGSKRIKTVWTQQKQKKSRRDGRLHRRTAQNDLDVLANQMVRSLTQSQTPWDVKSGGPQEAALGTKLAEVMGFQLSCFKSWKMMLWKCCTQYARKLGKLRSGHTQDWKRSIFIPISKKVNAKECSSYHTVALISHASKVMLKILQPRFQQYVNWKCLDVQAGFREGRGTRDQTLNIRWIIEKAREFQKNFCFTD